MAYRNEARGIGGWLLVFLIFYCVLAPLLELLAVGVQVFGPTATYVTRIPALVIMRNVMIVQISVQIAVQVFVGFRLCRIFTPMSVRITIAALWLLGPLTIGAGVIVDGLLSGIRFAIWTHSLTLSAVQVVLFAGGWTIYFLLSARVANTYYHLDEEIGLSATFA